MSRSVLAVSLVAVFSSYAFSGLLSNKAGGTLDHKDLDLTGIGEKAYYGDVCGDMVVYSVGRACDFSWNVKYKNLKTGEIGSFFGVKGGTIDNQTKIDGEIVVWCGGPLWKTPWTHEPSNFSVFARNISTGAQKTLREYTMSESYSHPAVSGNKVVWLEHSGLDPNPKGRKGKNWWNTPFNICGADITNIEKPVYFTVATNVGSRDPYPCLSYWKSFDNVIDISGDTVVWEANGDIYGADISDLNKVELFTICNHPDGQYNPAISGDTIVWTDRRNDGGDIYGASILDMKDIKSFPIIRKAGIQRQPAIDKDVIVYVSSWGIFQKSGYGEIKICRLTDFPESVKVNLKEKYSGQRPAINNNSIIWQGKNSQKGTAAGISIDRLSFDGKPADITGCRME